MCEENWVEFSHIQLNEKYEKCYYQHNNGNTLIRIGNLPTTKVIPRELEFVPMSKDWISDAFKRASLQYAVNNDIKYFIPIMVKVKASTTVAALYDCENNCIVYLNDNTIMNCNNKIK